MIKKNSKPKFTKKNYNCGYMNELRKKIEVSINSVSAENGSDTPDFILAEYLIDCLITFDKAVNRREKWYGKYI